MDIDILERISEYFQGENDENHRKLLRDAMGTIRELRADKPATVDSTCPRWVPLPKPGVTVTTGPQTNTHTFDTSAMKQPPAAIAYYLLMPEKALTAMFSGEPPELGAKYAYTVTEIKAEEDGRLVGVAMNLVKV